MKKIMTLDPTYLGQFKGDNIRLTEDKLTASLSAGYFQHIRSNYPLYQGKLYWEFTFGMGIRTCVGVLSSDFIALESNTSGYAYGMNCYSWQKDIAGVNSYFPDIKIQFNSEMIFQNINDCVISFMLDFVNKEFRIYYNNTIHAIYTDFPDGIKLYPYVGWDSSYGGASTGTFNFGTTPFNYSVPAGYLSVNDAINVLTIINADNKLYGYDISGIFKELHTDYKNISNTDLYNIFNDTMYRMPTLEDINSINHSTFKLLKYSFSNIPPHTTIHAHTNDTLVVPNKLINLLNVKTINNVYMDTNNENCRIFIIKKLNNSELIQYLIFENGNWENIDVDNIQELVTSGINPTVLPTILKTEWDKLLLNDDTAVDSYIEIGFGYLLISSNTDPNIIDSINAVVNLTGTWKRAIKQKDFNYGYNNNTTLRVKFLSNGDYKINYNQSKKVGDK